MRIKIILLGARFVNIFYNFSVFLVHSVTLFMEYSYLVTTIIFIRDIHKYLYFYNETMMLCVLSCKYAWVETCKNLSDWNVCHVWVCTCLFKVKKKLFFSCSTFATKCSSQTFVIIHVCIYVIKFPRFLLKMTVFHWIYYLMFPNTICHTHTHTHNSL